MSSLRDLLAAATPRPWLFRRNPGRDEFRGEFRAPNPHNGFMLVQAFTNAADAALIVALVNQADQLLNIAGAADRYVTLVGAAEDHAAEEARVVLVAALARLDATKEQT